jgi:hypothetical protein
MVSSDLFAQIGRPEQAAAPAPAFDPMKTQKLPSGSESTQRIDVAAAAAATRPDANSTLPLRTPVPVAAAAVVPPNERTQEIVALDPNWKPEATQKLEDFVSAAKPPAAEGTEAQVTQRLDDSIWRLQEARRILQGLPQKQ